MRRSKKTLLILWVLTIVFIFTGCSRESEVIKIGFSYELTGPNSELGRDAMYGALLAVDVINSSGGVKGKMIELVIKDDEGDPDTGVLVDNELIDEGCVLVVGHGTSNMADKTIANANENDFILFSPTVSTYEVEGIDDNFFRTIPSNRTQGSGLAEFMDYHSKGDYLIFTETSNSAFTNTVRDSFLDYLNEINYSYSNLDSIHFTSKDESSYQNVINTIDETTATNVIIIGSSYDVSNITQKVTNEEIMRFIPVWATTSDIFNLTGSTIDYTHGINYFDNSSQKSEFLEFVQDYEDNYGIPASFSSMLSYETLMTIWKALDNAADYSTESIKESILSVGTVNWLIDDITFTEDGDSTRKLYWYHLIDGEFIEVIK